MFRHVDSEDSDQTGRYLSLRWAQRSFCWFCHEAAQICSFNNLSRALKNSGCLYDPLCPYDHPIV